MGIVSSSESISPAGVREAAARLSGVAIRTPLIENLALNEITGARVFLKAEVLQWGAAFKFRGAYNMLSQIPVDERRRGVIAWSSGNHGQGVARAARLLGMKATIVMPKDAPKVKADAVRALGAEIVLYDRYTDDREEITRAIMQKRDYHFAPSFDHPAIIEGQGTVALETLEQLADFGIDHLDMFVACCGGGGLTAGCATYLEEAAPDCEIMIAEPEGYGETWQSIASGKRCFADVLRPTICDAIATPTPGELTLPIMARRVTGGASVSESDVAAAIRFGFEHLKLVIEPGGAVALASVINGAFPVRGRNVGVTLSGGNIDPELYAKIVNTL